MKAQSTDLAVYDGGQSTAVAPVRAGFDVGAGQLVSFEQALTMADIMCTDKTLPETMRSPGAIFSALLLADATHIPLITVLRGAHIINGKLGLDAAVRHGAVLASGLCDEWTVLEATPEVYRLRVKRRGQQAQERSYTIEQARAAGLLDKSGPWRSYPERMLKARVTGWACDDVFPDVMAGIPAADVIEEVEAREERVQPQQADRDPDVSTREVDEEAATAAVEKAAKAARRAALAELKGRFDLALHNAEHATTAAEAGAAANLAAEVQEDLRATGSPTAESRCGELDEALAAMAKRLQVEDEEEQDDDPLAGEGDPNDAEELAE